MLPHTWLVDILKAVSVIYFASWCNVLLVTELCSCYNWDLWGNRWRSCAFIILTDNSNAIESCFFKKNPILLSINSCFNVSTFLREGFFFFVLKKTFGSVAAQVAEITKKCVVLMCSYIFQWILKMFTRRCCWLTTRGGDDLSSTVKKVVTW